MSEQEKKYSDFEQRRALQEFHRVATQDYVEEIADDIFIKHVEFSGKQKYLTDLVAIFDNADRQDIGVNWAYFMGRAIRHRDADLLNMIANESYAPYSEIYNSRFTEKMDALCNNTATPALRAVKN